MNLKVVITVPYMEEHIEIPIKLNETLIALLFFFFEIKYNIE